MNEHLVYDGLPKPVEWWIEKEAQEVRRAERAEAKIESLTEYARALQISVTGRQLEIAGAALSKIESDKRYPLPERPWAIAERALRECREIAAEATGDRGVEIKSSRYSVEDLKT